MGIRARAAAKKKMAHTACHRDESAGAVQQLLKSASLACIRERAHGVRRLSFDCHFLVGCVQKEEDSAACSVLFSIVLTLQL
jgi:hypothetical protein